MGLKARALHTTCPTDQSPETQKGLTCPRSPREVAGEPGPEMSALNNPPSDPYISLSMCQGFSTSEVHTLGTR